MSIKRSRMRKILLASSALAGSLVMAIGPAAAQEKSFSLSLPAQPLGKSLMAFGSTTDQLVLTGKLNALLGSRGGDWEILTTSAFVTIIVPLIVFFSLQRYFVRGLLAGSVKGG